MVRVFSWYCPPAQGFATSFELVTIKRLFCSFPGLLEMLTCAQRLTSVLVQGSSRCDTRKRLSAVFSRERRCKS